MTVARILGAAAIAFALGIGIVLGLEKLGELAEMGRVAV